MPYSSLDFDKDVLMKGRTIAIVGLSGVGKTTLISQFLEDHQHPALHVSAGRLLREYRRAQDVDELRVLSREQIESNQIALVKAFKDFRNSNPARDILFDGHCIIDNDVGLVRVPLEVFTEISPDSFVFVKAHPNRILERRAGDVSRARPQRTQSDIDEQQRLAEELVVSYSHSLGIPYLAVNTDMREDFGSFLLDRLS